MEKKKILVLNGSFCEKPIIEKAKEMGYYVVSTGNDPKLIGHRFSDEYIPCDYSDRKAILKLVKDNGIEGIVSCANDFGVLTAAYVAEQMGWRGHDSYAVSELLHHKDKFKQYCYERQIPSPQSISFEAKETALEYCQSCEYPVIVKANDLTGGKGICRANNFTEAAEAIENAFSMSRDKHILVEPYLVGSQGTFFAFLVNQEIVVTASCRCYSQKNPYLIQAETYPAIGVEKISAELQKITLDMAEDLNLADGIFALQFIECNEKPYVIEMMRRSFGNEALLLCDMTTGFPWEEAYIKASLGLDCTDMKAAEPPMKYCGHFGVMADCNGVVKSYKIPQEIEKHLFKKLEMVQPGERINHYLNERIAYLYYRYDDIEEMNQNVVHFNEMIEIEMEADKG